MLGTLEILPSQDVRKVGMTSNQHGPYVRGYTRVTMGDTEGRHRVTGRHEAGFASNRASAMAR